MPALQPAPRERAVVLGASIAGLLAARVLHDHHAEVVLIERDTLQPGPVLRKGTPQAGHPHGLLARGCQALEQLFPGFTQALRDRGAVAGDLQRDVAFEASRQRLAGGVAGVQALGVSRPAIEAELRRRVLALPRVRLIDGADIVEPGFAQGRVHEARYVPRDGHGRVQALPATLVVDCCGRASATPRWLQDWGYAPPHEERVDIDICYTSVYFRRDGACTMGPGLDRVAVIGSATPELPRPAVVIAQEPDEQGVARWVAGVGGYGGDHVPATLAAFRQRAQELQSPELLKLATDGEPLGEPLRYRVACSLRRHYQRLRRFPDGLLVMGDALTAFNPIYGQGMTVAACQALALQDALRAGGTPLWKGFFRAASRVVDTPWQLAVGGDLAIDRVPGPRPLPVRLVNAYVDRLRRVAVHDAGVSRTFLRVVHMLDEPSALFAPAVLWRVLCGPLRRAYSAPRQPGAPQRQRSLPS